MLWIADIFITAAGRVYLELDNEWCWSNCISSDQNNWFLSVSRLYFSHFGLRMMWIADILTAGAGQLEPGWCTAVAASPALLAMRRQLRQLQQHQVACKEVVSDFHSGKKNEVCNLPGIFSSREAFNREIWFNLGLCPNLPNNFHIHSPYLGTTSTTILLEVVHH